MLKPLLVVIKLKVEILKLLVSVLKHLVVISKVLEAVLIVIEEILIFLVVFEASGNCPDASCSTSRSIGEFLRIKGTLILISIILKTFKKRPVKVKQNTINYFMHCRELN